MKKLLGNIFTGLITDENDKSYFVQKDGFTFRLDKTEGAYDLGQAVEGFGYINQNDHLRFTTKLPASTQDSYAFGKVVLVKRDLGVFIDIGLPDKEIALSLDELPSLRELWPKSGDRVMIAIRVDDRDRMWAVLADEALFDSLAEPAEETMHNQDIEATAYRLKVVGTYVITSDNHLGFIHPSERWQEPRLGELVKGRVIGVRPDGLLNISLKPRAHEVISDDAQMILTFLEKSPDGKIPFTDKSSPDEIDKAFAISKGQFKRALGSLMKARRIKQRNGYTELIKETEKPS